jgi:SNF2 family DNA or RNA helicase
MLRRAGGCVHGDALSDALCEGVSWWRVVLDEAQTCFDANSSLAKAVSWLWKSNVWCTTGTPLGNSLNDLHGLFEILDHDPFADATVLAKLLTKPYKHRERGAYHRLRSLLRQILLRREHDDPDVAAATQLAPPVIEAPQLRLSAAEALRVPHRLPRS